MSDFTDYADMAIDYALLVYGRACLSSVGLQKAYQAGTPIAEAVRDLLAERRNTCTAPCRVETDAGPRCRLGLSASRSE